MCRRPKTYVVCCTTRALIVCAGSRMPYGAVVAKPHVSGNNNDKAVWYRSIPGNLRSATMASKSVCCRQHDRLLSATTVPNSLSRVPYCSKLDGMFSFGPGETRRRELTAPPVWDTGTAALQACLAPRVLSPSRFLDVLPMPCTVYQGDVARGECPRGQQGLFQPLPFPAHLRKSQCQSP